VFEFSYLGNSPIITVDEFPELDGNINGPSLVRCPAWVTAAPAKYLLYFAHHEGQSIRLAIAEDLQGPWRLHKPSPMALEDSHFAVSPPGAEKLHAEAREFIERGADGDYPHIASPDVWVDHDNQQFRLYYHGRLDDGRQRTRVALSGNGIDFTASPSILATSYLRLFRHDGWYYALTMPAQLYRSRDGLANFEPGPQLTDEAIRHHALLNFRGEWYVFWTRVGDQPERILVSRLQTGPDWKRWHMEPAMEVHRARKTWEGGNLTIEASQYGAIMEPVNQLRDPAIFEENGRIYLLYAIAGEQGIAIGELTPVQA